MHLERYPMDIQRCVIQLASYAYTTADIEYIWKSIDPVQLKSSLRTNRPSFALTNVTTGTCTSCTNTGTCELRIMKFISLADRMFCLGCYGCLETSLILRRQFSFYVVQVYAPTLMLVIVSWVSFFLDPNAVVGRTALAVTTLLTMTAQVIFF